MDPSWVDVGAADELAKTPVREVRVGRTLVALTWKDGAFGAISGVCNHVGGPARPGPHRGRLRRLPLARLQVPLQDRQGRAGVRERRGAPVTRVKVEGGRVLVSAEPVTKRSKPPHEPHPARAQDRARGGTAARARDLDDDPRSRSNPRVSTSELLLEVGARARADEARRARRSSRASARSRSGAARATTRRPPARARGRARSPRPIRRTSSPQVYEDLVFWADVVLVATPIRWGAASSLYFKLAERMNCIQNQITTHDRVLIRNKVAAFVITGGQDNVQAVAGQMLMFFGELGFHFPQFPFIAHSRGWTAEDMEKNVAEVQKSQELRDGAAALVERAVAHSCLLNGHAPPVAKTVRAGRKAQRLEVEESGRSDGAPGPCRAARLDRLLSRRRRWSRASATAGASSRTDAHARSRPSPGSKLGAPSLHRRSDPRSTSHPDRLLDPGGVEVAHRLRAAACRGASARGAGPGRRGARS